MAKGFEYAYAYKNEDERISFLCADSLGVVEVKEKETDDGCAYVIYHYVDRIGKDNKQIRRIQVWDEAETWFYVQEDDGKIIPDDTQKINPRPHILYNKDGDENTYFEGFGFIPFFRLDNCRKQFSGLKPIKDLIDDYDLMSCGLSNNIQDTNEALYEMVFNTSMVGYQEIISDPSCLGQIVVMAYPLIGNYGITDEDFSILFNGATRQTGDAHIFDRKVIERDITCKNGYIHVLDALLMPAFADMERI